MDGIKNRKHLLIPILFMTGGRKLRPPYPFIKLDGCRKRLHPAILPSCHFVFFRVKEIVGNGRKRLTMGAETVDDGY